MKTATSPPGFCMNFFERLMILALPVVSRHTYVAVPAITGGLRGPIMITADTACRRPISVSAVCPQNTLPYAHLWQYRPVETKAVYAHTAPHSICFNAMICSRLEELLHQRRRRSHSEVSLTVLRLTDVPS